MMLNLSGRYLGTRKGFGYELQKQTNNKKPNVNLAGSNKPKFYEDSPFQIWIFDYFSSLSYRIEHIFMFNTLIGQRCIYFGANHMTVM